MRISIFKLILVFIIMQIYIQSDLKLENNIFAACFRFKSSTQIFVNIYKDISRKRAMTWFSLIINISKVC